VVVRTSSGGTGGVAGQVRYDMLEPVAQYARSLLTGDELRRTSRAHAAFFLALAEQAAPGYERDEQVVWLARTEAEESNLLVALERSLDDADATTAGRVTWLLWLYWWLRGQVRVGRAAAERCLATDLPVGLRGRVLLTAATMSFAGGDLPASERFWAQALALGEQESDPELVSKALAGTGLAAMATGDLATAAQRFRWSIPATREAGEAGVWLRSLVHVWRGTVLLHQGDPEAAVAETERGLLLARDRGDRLSTYVALYGLSQAAVAGGRVGEARGHLEEGIRLSEQTQDMANLAYFLDALAVVEAAEGEAARVAVLLGAAQAIRETVGSNVYGYYLPDLQARDAAAAAALEQLGQDAYEDAVDAGRASEPGEAIAHALRRG
jgi:tetratricopeptide (TPR) repeat protein